MSTKMLISIGGAANEQATNKVMSDQPPHHPNTTQDNKTLHGMPPTHHHPRPLPPLLSYLSCPIHPRTNASTFDTGSGVLCAQPSSEQEREKQRRKKKEKPGQRGIGSVRRRLHHWLGCLPRSAASLAGYDESRRRRQLRDDDGRLVVIFLIDGIILIFCNSGGGGGGVVELEIQRHNNVCVLRVRESHRKQITWKRRHGQLVCLLRAPKM
ncbi:hypothetical protein BKA81DRAFT_167412 [Phyllosticta paracitricarpa]|uniref:Uncharacterized protein n=1 Tax=Phyllosticta paracitricarpa TaxID=2016321 RepID=A0ABR1NBM5_9PEZI